ncbi:Intraflagellar transport protein 81, partial [Chamberlinius hualienensis]
MSDQLKFIIQKLNQPPFNETYNVITFDALDGRRLLQILVKIFTDIDPTQKSEFSSGSAEEAFIHIFSLLQICKYPVPETDAEQFEQRLMDYDVKLIRDVIEWLLMRIPEVRKILYLGRFLLKLEIPQEFFGDVDISELYNQYLEMIETFKDSHKQVEQLRTASLSTTEIKQDIDNLLDEKKQLAKRVDKLKKKISGLPNADEILEVARNLRQERDREESLNIVKQEQRNAIHHADQKLQRFKSLLKELKQYKSDMTPEALIQNLEQELQVTTYIIQDKLPKEMKLLQTQINDLEKAATNNHLKRNDLNTLYNNIQDLNLKISKMVEKKLMTNDPMDDKLSMFRQQAAIISRKKATVAETIKDLRNEVNSLEAQLKAKQAQLKELGGVEILKGDEFKAYVAKLRGKSDEYKKKRQEQNEIRAQLGVLSRTAEILRKRFDESEEALSALETEKGFTGIRNGGEGSEMKEESVSELTETVRSLNSQIQIRKTSLSPMVKDLQQLRQSYQDLLPNYEKKKTVHNSVAAGLEVNQAKLQREVNVLEDEFNSLESQIYFFQCAIGIQNVQLEVAKNELKNYLSADQAIKKQSLREQLSQCIQEQEKLSKTLKDEQKNIRESHESNLKQVKMWNDLQRLLECNNVASQQSSYMPPLIRYPPG